MIRRLHGQLVEKSVPHVVIDCNGVGYGVSVPLSTFDRLPPEGEAVILKIYLSIREDDWALFGFATDEERRLFGMLVSVSGVGPKMALNALSALSTDAFVRAIVNGEVATLKKINGVGKRMAERMVVELREKVGQVGMGASMADVAEQASVDQSMIAIDLADAVAALESLGYNRDKAKKTVDALAETMQPDERSTENLIRKALSQLNS